MLIGEVVKILKDLFWESKKQVMVASSSLEVEYLYDIWTTMNYLTINSIVKAHLFSFAMTIYHHSLHWYNISICVTHKIFLTLIAT